MTAHPLTDRLPEMLFVFVNDALPAVAHNLQFTHRLASAASAGLGDPDFAQKYAANEIDWLPFVSNSAVTPWMSFYGTGMTADYRAEFDAEIVRRTDFAMAPSRLSALFAFGDRASCEEAAKRYRWELGQVRKFRMLPSRLSRVVRVNMEIVSLARLAYRTSMVTPELRDAIWQAYWSGSAEFALELPTGKKFGREVVRAGTLWEYLIDGGLELIDQDHAPLDLGGAR